MQKDKTNEAIKRLVDDVAKAIDSKDLSVIEEICLTKDKLKSWVEANDYQAALKSGHKAIESLQSDLKLNDEKLKALAEVGILTAKHWRFYELSRKNFPQYDVSIFFTVGNKIVVTEFMVAQLDDYWCLIQHFNLKQVDSTLQRHLNDRHNSFSKFQSATQWPSDIGLLLAAEKIEKTLKQYQDICIKHGGDDPQIEFSDVQSVKLVESVQKKINKTFPATLLNWWLDGSMIGFRDGDWYAFELFTPNSMQGMMENQALTHSVKTMGLAEVMDYFHSGEFKNILSTEEYETLNIKYTVVGVYRQNDSDALYIYFDEDHQFGVVEYNHDWLHFGRTEWDAEYRTRLKTLLTAYDLPELVSELITLSAFELWKSDY